MTTVQITLPDELAPEAAQPTGRQAVAALRTMWERAGDELTPEIEQQIVDEVRASRAERQLQQLDALIEHGS